MLQHLSCQRLDVRTLLSSSLRIRRSICFNDRIWVNAGSWQLRIVGLVVRQMRVRIGRFGPPTFSIYPYQNHATTTGWNPTFQGLHSGL
jgi:hypothetical protein